MDINEINENIEPWISCKRHILKYIDYTYGDVDSVLRRAIRDVEALLKDHLNIDKQS